MTGNSGTSVRVDGTGYTLEYAVTESRGEEEPGGIEEYGIRCVLFAEGKSVSEEEIRHISSDYGLMCRLLEKLIKNQVFQIIEAMQFQSNNDPISKSNTKHSEPYMKIHIDYQYI